MVASVIFTQLLDINLPAAVVVVLVVVVVILFVVVLAVSGGGIAVAAIVVSLVGVEEEVGVVHADLGKLAHYPTVTYTQYVL